MKIRLVDVAGSLSREEKKKNSPFVFQCTASEREREMRLDGRRKERTHNVGFEICLSFLFLFLTECKHFRHVNLTHEQGRSVVRITKKKKNLNQSSIEGRISGYIFLFLKRFPRGLITSVNHRFS